MCVCVYLGRVHAYILLCVLPSLASCAGEHSSPSLQSLLSCGAKTSWGWVEEGLAKGTPRNSLSQRKVPKFPGVLCHWPIISQVSSCLSSPERRTFPQQPEGERARAARLTEGKLRTQLDPVASPGDAAALGGGPLSWERLPGWFRVA